MRRRHYVNLVTIISLLAFGVVVDNGFCLDDDDGDREVVGGSATIKGKRGTLGIGEGRMVW